VLPTPLVVKGEEIVDALLFLASVLFAESELDVLSTFLFLPRCVLYNAAPIVGCVAADDAAATVSEAREFVGATEPEKLLTLKLKELDNGFGRWFTSLFF
jgi:hypothetical protein